MKGLTERIHENGIDYILCGDYYIPELEIPRQDRPIGHYGRLRKAYLQQYRPVLFQQYLTEGTLYTHLAAVNEAAQERMDVMITQLMHEWGVDEDLKDRDEMAWVRLMNQARHCADENVTHELICV